MSRVRSGAVVAPSGHCCSLQLHSPHDGPVRVVPHEGRTCRFREPAPEVSVHQESRELLTVLGADFGAYGVARRDNVSGGRLDRPQADKSEGRSAGGLGSTSCR